MALQNTEQVQQKDDTDRHPGEPENRGLDGGCS
jgi:hypothetical protein